MKTILHTTGELSTIEYDPTVPCLIDTIGEFLFRAELRAHLNKVLELLVEKKQVHGQIGLLANSALMDAFFDDNVKRAIDDWTPRLKQAGIRYIATVESENDAEKMSNEEFQSFFETTLPSGLVLKKFKDLESAKEWLRSSLNKN